MSRLGLAGLVLAVVSCTESSPTDDVIVVAPAFPADFEATYVKARDCRHSHEHELHYIRVFASPEAAEPYAALDRSFPVGSTLVKLEYEDEDCQDLLGYTVMHREPEGYAPTTFNWRWQEVDPNRNVLSDEPFPPRCIACHTSHCQPPKGQGYELACADDSAKVPTTR